MSEKYINPDAAASRGYLIENYRLFHLNSVENADIPPHYHEFHKVLFFASGNLDYLVEGHTYTLMPSDILIIPANAIHQPFISNDAPYERRLLWIKDDFVRLHGLEKCFESPVRINNYNHSLLNGTLDELEQSVSSDEFASDQLSDALITQLLIYLCRWRYNPSKTTNEYSDPVIDEILVYINNNLSEDLSTEKLSDEFYLSRSRLMHLFKEVTGITIHQYILQKRLILSTSLLSQKINATEVASLCGFSDYSTFFRAFQKEYGVTPKQYK